MKQLYQVKYFNRFMSLNRNATLMSLTTNGTIDWKTSQFYLNFNGNKLSTDFESSGLKMFKIKCLTETLPTLTVLKVRYPFLYNNYEWSCPNDVKTIEYGNIITNKRYKMDENFIHLWTCFHVQQKVIKIIEDFKIRILHNMRTIYPETNIMALKLKINKLHCLLIPTTKQMDFINLSRGLIPIELVFILGNAGCLLQNA